MRFRPEISEKLKLFHTNFFDDERVQKLKFLVCTKNIVFGQKNIYRHMPSVRKEAVILNMNLAKISTQNGLI